MKNKSVVRILSLVLVLIMSLSLAPVSVSAETTGDNETAGWSAWWNRGLGGNFKQLPLDPIPVDEGEREDIIAIECPAVDFSEVIDDLFIFVDAPVGALPDGTEMTVTKVENMEAVQAAVDAMEDVEGTALVAADITFWHDGEEIQPNRSVSVTMTSDALPQDGDLTVVHLDAAAEELSADVSADRVSGVSIDANSVTFQAEHFSTFTVVWRSDWFTSQDVTVHHGHMENGRFVEFTSAECGNTNYPGTLNINNYGNNDYAFLIYDFPGYRYVQTRLLDRENSNPTTGTAIWPVIQRSNSTYAPRWNYRDASQNTFGRSGELSDNQHIYLIYEPKTVSVGYDGSGSGGDEPGQPTPSGFTPDVGKNVSDMQSDGTYDITLGFVGSKDTSEQTTTARVIVVFDLSNSMNWNMAGGTTTSATNPSRLRLAKDAVEALAEELLSLTDSKGNKLVEMGLVTFGTTASIETFGNNAQFTKNYNTGDAASRFYNKVEDLSAASGINGGTNWEAALDLANSMATSAQGKTYIVFVSDGDPTFRTSRGSYSDDTIQGETNTDDKRNLAKIPVFGDGNSTATITRCYNAARDIAKSIVDNKKVLYAVGLSNNATNMTNLATYSGGTYKSGDNAEEFAASLADIAGAISSEVGLTDVAITDGVTSMSQIETQALIGTAGNFTYNRSYPLSAAEGGGYTYTIGTTSYNVTQAQVEAGSDGTHRIYTRRNSAGIDIYYIEYPWDGAPEAEILADNSVKWDTSEANDELEDGVYYSVTFTVWPKQEAFDLIADLDNHITTISEQEESVKQQLRVMVSGTTYEYDTTSKTWMPGGLTDAQLETLAGTTASYSVKTNTGLSASYKYGGVTGSSSYSNYTNGNMTLDTTSFSLVKDWVNVLPQDSRTAQWLRDEDGSIAEDPPEGYTVDEKGYVYLNGEHVLYIDLIVTKDGDEYTQVRLRSDQGWRYDDMFISLGVLSVTDGVITVREDGHNYTVEELPSDAYYWELTAYVYRPMYINGITTMLQKLEEGDEGYETGNALEDNHTDGTYYKFGGGVYLAISNQDAVMEAVNHRRSYLDLTKVVNETNAPTDALFEYTIKVTVPGSKTSTDPDFNVNTDPVWFSVFVDGAAYKELEVSDNVTAEVDSTGANTGYFWVDSGEEFTVKLKAGWNFRSSNLLSGTTYEITESSTMEPGFEFDSVAATAEKEGETVDYTPTVTGAKIEGEIEEPNTDYTVTYTNKYVGYFFVYHSSNNTVERVYLTDARVTKAEDGTRTFNIVDEVLEESAGVKYLYGGYYHAYAGSTIAEDEGDTLTYTENLATDAGGTAYSYAYIQESAMQAWAYGDAYQEAAGTEMNPVAYTVYFLKEVPTGYLKPYNHYTYYKANNKIANMWLITALDDGCYNEAFFEITDTKTGAKVVRSLGIKAANSSTTTTLNAGKVFRASQGVLDGYLGYAEITDQLNKAGVVLEMFWKTPDGVDVHGTLYRTLDTSGDKGFKGKVGFEDTAYDS